SRVVRSKLPSGARVSVLTKKTANNIVSGTIDLRFGDAASLVNQREAAALAGSLLMAGTKSHSRQQLQEEFRKLNAQVTVSGGGGGARAGGSRSLGTATATISAPAENFFAAMRLAVEILRTPALPADDFERAKTQRIRALEQPQTEPTQMATDRLNRYFSPFS